MISIWIFPVAGLVLKAESVQHHDICSIGRYWDVPSEIVDSFQYFKGKKSNNKARTYTNICQQ